MDMASTHPEHLVFYLTGRRSGELEPIEGLGLRPALFARVHDLTRLRYDFPLVLARGEDAEGCVHTLSGVVDAVLQAIAPRGIAGERQRRNVLRLELEIRALLGEGATGSLSELWQRAAERLAALGGEAMRIDLARARAALAVEGALADCDAQLPAHLAAHVWEAVQLAKARATRRRIGEIAIRLSDLVRADDLRSQAGRGAETLRASIGAAHQALFDFDAMARMLARPSGSRALSESRRRRIEATLRTLRASPLLADDGGTAYRFDDVETAIGAFRGRLPAMAELVKAMAIAELELDGHYVEEKHDAHFAAFGAASLEPADLELFPDYLVCQPARMGIVEALASGVPLKIVAVCHDAADAPLAGAAMLTGETYVLQAASARLYDMRRELVAAMRHPGPALVSVYAGTITDVPSYLTAAAAAESRAFPSFSYDPCAGPGWAERFSLATNLQPDADWPEHEFSWADEALQRKSERLAFTYADFALCDPRQAARFARVPREAWDEVPGTIPWLYALDAEQRLHKLIVDQKLAHAVQRYADGWRRLRELDSLKRPPEEKEEKKQEEKKQEERKEETPREHATGEPYIETPRCSSCNECTTINGAMFAYNENQQAYIADPGAGTFAQLVEAAESCQLSIIHPGKPRNADEPGLEGLIKRAEPFQ